jgi:hypothetical protein
MRVNPSESIDQLQRALTDEWNNTGQGRVRMWLSLRKCIATREIWHLALSCRTKWLKWCVLSDGRVGIYRRRRERFADRCVKQTDRFGGGGVMVWGGISDVGKTNLKIVVGNLNHTFQNATLTKTTLTQPITNCLVRNSVVTYTMVSPCCVHSSNKAIT